VRVSQITFTAIGSVAVNMDVSAPGDVAGGDADPLPVLG
jgi:hypothetical protein